MTGSVEAGALIFLLQRDRAVEPRAFPADRAAAARPGLYAWWGDSHARSTLGGRLDSDLPELLYVGQAGATRWPSGKRSSATLGSRIRSQHIRGNARSSTFRLTVSCLLMEALQLKSEGGRLDRASNLRVSEWIATHLHIAIAPFDDRDKLGVVEAEVVRVLDPPLNLDHCASTPCRARLTELRRSLPRATRSQ